MKLILILSRTYNWVVIRDSSDSLSKIFCIFQRTTSAQETPVWTEVLVRMPRRPTSVNVH